MEELSGAGWKVYDEFGVVEGQDLLDPTAGFGVVTLGVAGVAGGDQVQERNVIA